MVPKVTNIIFASFKMSSINSTNLLELTRELISKAVNFTNKEVCFRYLLRILITGVRLLSPVNQSNDMMALNFSRVSKCYYSTFFMSAAFEKRPADNRLDNRPTNRPTDQSVSQSVSQSVCQSFSQSVCQSVWVTVYLLISQPINQLTCSEGG